MTEAAALLTLLRLPGVGAGNLRLILARLFQIGVPVERLEELTDPQLALDLRLNPEQICALRSPPSSAEEDIKECQRLGIQLLLPRDALYPLRVLHLLGRTAPAMIFAQGNLDLLTLPILGISGSRLACEASLSATSQLCEKIASQGWVIVSGGARGTDEAAHLAALRQGPGTIIILPTGILKPNLRSEFKKQLEEGKTLVLSEFPPEIGWTVGCAMQRNRLLASLSWVLTLVEPGITGGTGGTGRIATKLNTPLFILQNGSQLGTGASQFLDRGAILLNPATSTRQLTLQMLQSHRIAENKRISITSQSLFPAGSLLP